jgi:hypothetical protein
MFIQIRANRSNNNNMILLQPDRIFWRFQIKTYTTARPYIYAGTFTKALGIIVVETLSLRVITILSILNVLLIAERPAEYKNGLSSAVFVVSYGDTRGGLQRKILSSGHYIHVHLRTVTRQGSSRRTRKTPGEWRGSDTGDLHRGRQSTSEGLGDHA